MIFFCLFFFLKKGSFVFFFSLSFKEDLLIDILSFKEDLLTYCPSKRIFSNNPYSILIITNMKYSVNKIIYYCFVYMSKQSIANPSSILVLVLQIIPKYFETHKAISAFAGHKITANFLSSLS